MQSIGYARKDGSVFPVSTLYVYEKAMLTDLLLGRKTVR